MITAYLAIDVETGGLDPRVHSLLEIAVVELRPHDGLLLPGKYFQSRVWEDPIVITPEAMAVNKIDLLNRPKDWQGPAGVASALRAWILNTWWLPTQGIAADGSRKPKAVDSICLVGWNVHFDRSFLGRLERLGGFVSPYPIHHRMIDVASTYNYRRCARGEKPLGLHDWIEQNQDRVRDIPGRPHEALYDALVAVEALNSCLTATNDRLPLDEVSILQ